ncbi:MAG: hypothetical protein KJ862_04575 [Proteobacteria bacterium]|nr:hypothetical protein [Pseudomonadota bacterium]
MVNVIEFIDRRVLGAVRFVDRATGYVLKRPLHVSADSVNFIRNRSFHYVIASAPGLESHTHAFEQPPEEPPLNTLPVIIRVEDPLKQYLPRIVDMLLPRDPDPDNAANNDSLFKALNVNLYPAGTAPVRANWSTVRGSITRNDEPIRGALLRVVRRADDEVLASGISDERGEALVIIPGVPITQFADEDDDNGNDDQPVIVTDLPVRLEISFDAGVPWPSNPDTLETNHATTIRAAQDLTLRTGRMERAIFALT